MKRFIYTVIAGYVLIMMAIVFQPKVKPAPLSISKAGHFQGNSSTMSLSGKMSRKAKQGIAGAKPLVSSDSLNPNKQAPRVIKTYFDNGKMSAEWKFSKKEKFDETIKATLDAYYDNGRIWFESEFKNGKQDGMTKFSYPDGFPWEEMSFKDGQPHGDFKIYYPGGVVWIEGVYEEGHLKSLPKLYSETGEEKKKVSFSKAEQPSAYFRSFDASGKVSTEWSQSEGKEKITLKTNYKSGYISSEWNMIGSALEGAVKFYYANGSVWNETVYRENKPMASLRGYYPSGPPQMEVKFSETGTRETTTVFYPSGKFWFSFDAKAGASDQIPRLFSETSNADRKSDAEQKSP